MPHETLPDAIAELIRTHLETRYGRRDDARHLATYAPGAQLVLGDRARRRGEVPDAEVLAAWAEADAGSVAWAGGSAGGADHITAGLIAKTVGVDPTTVNYIAYSGGGEALAALLGGQVTVGISGYSEFAAQIEAGELRVLAVSSASPHGADAGMAVVALHEAQTAEPAEAVFGVARADEGWRIEWATLLDGPLKGYDAQRFTALAELANLKAMALNGPLTSLLEAAWARTRWMPKLRFLALPETHFSCMGSGACCSHELTIGLDDNARRFVEAVDWPALVPSAGEGPFLEELPEEALARVSFRHKLTRDEHGRCRFLSADNRCTIHALAGRAVFKPCHVFPMRFAWTPDGVCVTTNAMCASARRGLCAPLAAQEADLRSRLAVADVLRTDRYYLRAGEAVPWETFRTLEGQLLELLKGDAPIASRGEITIKQKLWVALRWFAERLQDPQAGVDPRWYEEAIPRQGLVQRMGLKRFTAAFDPCFAGLKGVEAGEASLPDVEDELSRFFRSLLFSKVTTYPYGLVAGLNYVALVHAVLERQVDRHAKKGISEAFWREFYAVITSGTFLPVLGACHQTPATMFARVAGSPQFGLNLLRL